MYIYIHMYICICIYTSMRVSGRSRGNCCPVQAKEAVRADIVPLEGRVVV